MIQYILGYGVFLLGSAIFVLAKAQKLKQIAEANPDPKVSFSWRKMWDKEYINVIMVLLGGIALIIFAPHLIGGATVDIKSTEGTVITTLELQSILDPFYFLVGLAGPSALFGFFGRYEKTLFNRVGLDTPITNEKP
jgi:hypothetical protein